MSLAHAGVLLQIVSSARSWIFDVSGILWVSLQIHKWPRNGAIGKYVGLVYYVWVPRVITLVLFLISGRAKGAKPKLTWGPDGMPEFLLKIQLFRSFSFIRHF